MILVGRRGLGLGSLTRSETSYGVINLMSVTFPVFVIVNRTRVAAVFELPAIV